ncbi:MAG TPA: hypothetical protein VFM99_07210, partial [Chitinophagales bacterium]|nr:hypothetical protein [Chitinophagales bacterium]
PIITKIKKMKTIYTLLFSILLAITAFGQDQTNNFEKKRLLKESADVSTAIFEGKVISKNKSFFSNKNQNTIYTSYTIQVEEVLFGTIKVGTIEIAVIGGQMERGGEVYSFESAHGTGLCSGNAIFFCKPFTEGNSGLSHSNTGAFTVISNVCYNSDGSIDPSPYPYNDSYKNKKELYKDLAKFKSITIPKEKKVQM